MCNHSHYSKQMKAFFNDSDCIAFTSPGLFANAQRISFDVVLGHSVIQLNDWAELMFYLSIQIRGRRQRRGWEMTWQHPSKIFPTIYTKSCSTTWNSFVFLLLFHSMRRCNIHFVLFFFFFGANRNLVQKISFTKKGLFIYLCNISHSSTMVGFRWYRTAYTQYVFSLS